MNKNIYITIACVEEPFLEQTILSAQSNSSGNNKLFFKVLNQSTKNEVLDLNHLNVNIELINYLADALHGLGKARMISNCSDLTKCDYVLQIDSHMIFSKNWDEYLIKYLNDLSEYNDKNIISGSMISWTLKNEKPFAVHKEIDPLNFDCEKENIMYNKIPIWSVLPKESLVARGHVDAASSHPLSGAFQYFEDNNKVKEIYAVAGGFVFAKKDLFENIIHDPWIFWGGDEVVFSMRAWTRGYKMFALDKPVILHYDKGDWTSLKNDWRMCYDESSVTVKDFGYLRIKNILLGNILGYWGAPSVEKLREYERLVNFSFKDFYKNTPDIISEELLQKIKYGDTLR